MNDPYAVVEGGELTALLGDLAATPPCEDCDRRPALVAVDGDITAVVYHRADCPGIFRLAVDDAIGHTTQ